MSDIRNPIYPDGMTMAELITTSESGPCGFCGRWSEPFTDETHDGMCAVPFMREAQAKLEAMERLWEYANHKESCWLETGPFGKAGEDHVCTCGYDDLLRAPAQEGQGDHPDVTEGLQPTMRVARLQHPERFGGRKERGE